MHHAALRLGAVPNPLNAIFRAASSGSSCPRPARRSSSSPLGCAVRRRRRSRWSSRGEIPRPRTGHHRGRRGVEGALGARGPARVDRARHRRRPPRTRRPTRPAPVHERRHRRPEGHPPLARDAAVRDRFPRARCTASAPEDRYLGGAPVSHIAGLVYGVLMPFALGTSTTFIDRWDAGRALEAIERDARDVPDRDADVPADARRGGRSRQAPALVVPAVLHRRRDIPTEAIIEAGSRARLRREARLRLDRGADPDRLDSATTPRTSACRRTGASSGRARCASRREGWRRTARRSGEILARSPEVFLGYADPSLDADAFDDDGWYQPATSAWSTSEGACE